jgi:hypothetical protein
MWLPALLGIASILPHLEHLAKSAVVVNALDDERDCCED